MAIEKRGETWWYRFTARGREYRKSTGLAASPQKKKDAEAIEARARLEVLSGAQQQPKQSSANFLEAVDDFLKWCYTTEYRSKHETARRIHVSFQSIVAFMGARKVSEIDADAIEAYKTWRIEKHGIRDVTLRHDLHALSVFFRKYALRKRLAQFNPVDQVTKPSDKDAVRIHIVNREEEGAYFARATGNLYDVSRLILLQGCRPEEVMRLRVEDVDLKTETLFIRGGKTRAARRELPLTGESVVILRTRIEKVGSGWLFPSRRFKGEHIVKLIGQHDIVCMDAGVSFCMYDLRHTFATRALTEAKMDVGTVAALMGHSSPTIVLKHYVHPTAEGKRSAMKDYEAAMTPRLKRVK
jgi:integrase